ncbi:heavy-metal-associated domain-containing protein [Salisaeta longa]|uniref:heavy-metal-associated domain-containing protein n=1 Tax=Salisaeta longa TaxID=503170 RepID=UPI0003B6CBD3|nr:heavy-metal-associated domain-containing protein [Salisaeta longa]
MKEETLIIEGMHCDHCVSAVRDALENVKGLTVQTVNVGSAKVQYDPSAVSGDALAQIISDAGYTLTDRTPAAA